MLTSKIFDLKIVRFLLGQELCHIQKSSVIMNTEKFD